MIPGAIFSGKSQKHLQLNSRLSRDYTGIGTVDFVLSRRARRINITIKDSRSVRVAVPIGVSLQTAEKFFLEHRDWVLKSLHRLKKTEESLQPFFHQNFRTREHTLILMPIDQPDCEYRINSDTIHFFYPSNQSVSEPDIQSKILTALIETWRQEAHRYLPGRVDFLAKQLGLRYNRLFIKNVKSRWGSCSSKNNINLNLQLMRFEDWIIDYIVIHELLHTKIRNHGRKFWNTLEKLVPRTREARQFMKSQRPYSFKSYLK